MKNYALIVLVLASFCAAPVQDSVKKIRIGFSQCSTVVPWRTVMNEEMRRETGFYPDCNIELVVKDANVDSKQQIQDINALVKSGIDLLIVSPLEAELLTPVVEIVYNSGIPVVIIDRSINSQAYTSYVGVDNMDIGKKAAHYSAGLLNHKGRILEITGSFGSTPATERSRSFHETIAQYPNIEIIKSIDGQWRETHVREITADLFSSWREFDLIFSHNDLMAYAAFESCRDYDMDPYILGIDGLTYEGGGVDMVVNGNITATFLNPTGGDKAIELAIDILKGKPFEKNNYLKTLEIDMTNAPTLKHQNDQIVLQQKRIDYQREQLGETSFLLRRQSTFALLSMVISGLLIIVAIGTLLFLRKKNKDNALLNQKNRTINKQTRRITEQRDKLTRLLRIAAEATEAKTKFFMNISHEFRNALSLVTLPIQDLASYTKNHIIHKKIVQVQKNTELLDKLADEILNFGKIEKNKYYLKFKTANFGRFTRQMIESFRPKIKQNGLTLITRIPDNVRLYFDASALEKVIDNLMDNAVKYNVEGGKIEIVIRKIRNCVIFTISDNGIGIPKQDLPFVFDRFYRSDIAQKNNVKPGTGLGLSICKDLVELHQGKIRAVNNRKPGSTFLFIIPQNFKKQESKPNWESTYKEKFLELKRPVNRAKVLIVEDNSELLTLISSLLGKYYTVVKASNGEEGMAQVLEQKPHIVLSDIYMPIMDGIELCQQIKSNPQTFHIPVILLTALHAEETQIRGLDTGADGYIRKPFNEIVLISQIQNLIKSRARLKDTFTAFPLPMNIKTKSKSQEEFINECIRIIHKRGSDASFKLDELAAEMNLSRSSLCRKIEDYTGMKAVIFMKRGKLHYAAKLLLTTYMTVGEVAYQSGFVDKKYFSKCFAKEYGDVPKKFKGFAQVSA